MMKLLAVFVLIITSCNQIVSQESVDYEFLALQYLVVRQQEIDPRISELEIQVPKSHIKVESKTWLTDVYHCLKDTSFRVDSEKELKSDIKRDAYTNLVSTKHIKGEKNVSLQKEKRKIEIYGPLHYKGEVYVEIKLLSKNELFGESLYFQFERGKKDVLRVCVNTWVI